MGAGREGGFFRGYFFCVQGEEASEFTRAGVVERSAGPSNDDDDEDEGWSRTFACEPVDFVDVLQKVGKPNSEQWLSKMGRTRLAVYHDYVVRRPSDEMSKDLMIDDILRVAFERPAAAAADGSAHVERLAGEEA